MSDTPPTKVTLVRAVQLCVLLLFVPKKFLAEEEADNKLQSERNDHEKCTHSAFVVRRAFWFSLVLVLASGLVGALFGVAAGYITGCAKTVWIVWLQIVGSLFLLWGTLFIRGWEIETWAGVTFTERVNQWLYRFLYCLGTAIIVFSLTWPYC